MLDQLKKAFEDLYPEICVLARAALRGERALISTGTLVHELYINLSKRSDVDFAGRRQLFGYLKRAVRSVLIDMARDRGALKRKAELVPLAAGADVHDHGATPHQLAELDDELQQLKSLGDMILQVASMRIYGLDIGAIAQALQVSPTTVKRSLHVTKAFLRKGTDASDERD